MVEQARIDLAAYGRDDEAGAGVVDARRTAEAAVMRASGALRFIEGTDEPAAALLRDLFHAVAPLFGTV